MTTRHHGDTEAPATGIEARLEDAFQWVNDHGREVLISAGALLLVGLLAAIAWEAARRSEADSRVALAEIEAGFSKAMGMNPSEALTREPANEQQANAAREQAVAELDTWLEENAGRDAAAAATIRAAEHEVDLGRLDAADVRLAALVRSLDNEDPARGIALRLRGYALEELGRHSDAAQAYAEGGQIEAFPPRALLLVAAAQAYARAGQDSQALGAYEQAIELQPEIGDNLLHQRRIAALRRLVAPPEPPAVSN